jgi:hypothetical protein
MEELSAIDAATAACWAERLAWVMAAARTFSHSARKRFNDRGQHEALDIRTRREVRAEGVALRRIERTLQQGAEDGGLDVLPLLAGRLLEQTELQTVHGQHGVIGKQGRH